MNDTIDEVVMVLFTEYEVDFALIRIQSFRKCNNNVCTFFMPSLLSLTVQGKA